MIDLQFDPFSPVHEADLARVGEHLAVEAGIVPSSLRVIGGWRPLSPIDPWYPTAREQRKGLWRWGPAGRVKDLADAFDADTGPTQEVVDDLRRHIGGPFGSDAHEHWRALTVTRVATPSIAAQSAGTSPPALALLTDREVVVLTLRSAAAMAKATRRLAEVQAGLARPTGPLAPFRQFGSLFADLGRNVAAIARGEQREDGLVVQSRSPLDGSRVAPLSAVAPDDHLRWRFADGSWLDVRLSHPEPAARREVRRRLEAAGVPVGSAEPFLLEP